MAHTLLAAHSGFRWLVLVAGLLAVVKMIRGSAKSSPWTPADRGALVLFTVSVDIQLLLGLAVFFTSPIVGPALGDLAASLQHPEVRTIVIVHPFTMLLALVLAHAGSVAAKGAPSDQARFDRAALLVTLSLGLLVLGIPWSRLFVT